jgi:hypothetical protein
MVSVLHGCHMFTVANLRVDAAKTGIVDPAKTMIIFNVRRAVGVHPETDVHNADDSVDSS